MSTSLAQTTAGCRPHIQSQRPMILCVDDDPDISLSIQMRLKPFNVTVTRAFHGMHGICEAVRRPPDLIIMDLAMPRGDGNYVLRCLRMNRETSTVPIIILTGMRDPAIVSRLISAGADGFLRKPLSFDDLLHNISRFVDLSPRNDELGPDGDQSD